MGPNIEAPSVFPHTYNTKCPVHGAEFCCFHSGLYFAGPTRGMFKFCHQKQVCVLFVCKIQFQGAA